MKWIVGIGVYALIVWFYFRFFGVNLSGEETEESELNQIKFEEWKKEFYG